MNTPPPPDYGEPWHATDSEIMHAIDRNDEAALFPLRNMVRAIACVNACAGMTDPAAEIAKLRRQREEAREENARLREALGNCREDSVELLGERDWWRDEPRCGFQERYAQTAKNIQIADALLTP